MDGKSLDLKQEKLRQLRQILPEAFTENKIDWQKLQAALGEDVETGDERYVLNWAGKSGAFRALQTPTTATLTPCPQESVDFDRTGHVFIEGENLEVLKVLQKAYYGKIKMIYIDPPYNTGNDSFIYPDKFSESRDAYLARVGDKDESGYLTREGLFRKNSRDSGHYHSNWLSMMYPRLFLARNLLRDDGVIFVSIDDNEVHNLRLLMNEVFGEENFVGLFAWKNKYGAGAKTKGFIEVHEYIICYSKNEIFDIESELSREQIREYEKNKDENYALRGGFVTQPLMTNSLDNRKNLQYEIEHKEQKIKPRKQWVWEKDRLLAAIKKNEVVIKKKRDGTFSVRAKVYLKDERGNIRKGKPLSLLNGPFNQMGTQEVADLIGKGIFNFPKPSELLRYFFGFTINNSNDKNGLYLDFFTGSGTTAHAVLDLNKEDNGNRKFICVQLPEKCDEKSEAFKAWRSAGLESLESLQEQLALHTDPVKSGTLTENVLYELLLKSGVPLTAKITHDDQIFWVHENSPLESQGGVSPVETDQQDVSLALLLEAIDEAKIKTVLTRKPQKVIALDRLFHGNDQLKTNTALQMKDAGIDYRTV